MILTFIYVWGYPAVMSAKTRPAGCCETALPPVALPLAERERLVAGFKALADPTRLDVFRLIAAQREPICACDIVDCFDVSQPTIAHHLKVLREAGLISVSRRGVWAWYAVDPAGIEVLQSATGMFAAPLAGFALTG